MTEYYSTVKRNEALTQATMWMNLKNILLSERSRAQMTSCRTIHSHEMSRAGKSIKTESSRVAARGWKGLFLGMGFPFGVMKTKTFCTKCH